MTINSAEALRAKAESAVADALDSALYCTRVWEAWDYGTMSEDDFKLVSEDRDSVAEITNAALEAVGFEALLAAATKNQQEV